jgi:ribosomal protein S18 acetylase RimI-like enzyme
MSEFLQAFDSNIKSKFVYLPSLLPHASIIHAHQMLLIDSGLSTDMFNILCSDGIPTREDIRTSIQYFRGKNQLYAFWTGFEQEPSWLEEELNALQLVQGEMEWAMACDLGKSQFNITQPINFDTRKVSNHNTLKDFIAVIQALLPFHEHDAIEKLYMQCAEALLNEKCPMSFFVGYENGKAQSTSSVFCQSNLASVFDVIVLPEMRGKGIGKWMTGQAMKHAKEKGIDTCVLTATNDAKYLYEKLGFELIKAMKVYNEARNPL